MLQKHSGITTPGCLFVLLVMLILGFAGYKVAEAYWSKYQVREQVREILVWAAAGQAKNEMEIAQNVIASVGGAGVQLHPRNIRIAQDTNTLTIEVRWTHELDFTFFTYPLPLEVNLTEIKRWGRGGLVVK